MRRFFMTTTMAANNRRTAVCIDVQRENDSRRATLSAKAQRRVGDGSSQPKFQFLRPGLCGRQPRKALGNDTAMVTRKPTICG